MRAPEQAPDAARAFGCRATGRTRFLYALTMHLRSVLLFVASSLTILLFFGAGEALARVARLPIPGSVLGMVLLTAALRLRFVPAALVRPAAEPLLRYMALFFIPPGVGLMLYLDLIRSEWPAIVGAAVVGTLAVLLVVGHAQQRLEGNA